MKKNFFFSKKINVKILFLAIFAFIIAFYLVVNFTVGKTYFNSIKNIFDNDQKNFIKKIFFPHKKIKELSNLTRPLHRMEIAYKDSLENIELIYHGEQELNKKIKLNKFGLSKGFYAGNNRKLPGSGYIDFHSNNFIIVSSRGVLAYSKNFEGELFLKQIKNNIDKYINIKHFEKDRLFSIEDLTIIEDNIFISFTEEIEKDCWNTSVIYSKMNYDNIEFSKLFSSDQCVHAFKNIDNEFASSQTGGRIVKFDNNHIFLSTGEYRLRHLAQNKDSVNGKILKININNSDYEIISMGHRNPQGLYYDKENNFILETEHGPKGGDEINLIELNQPEIPNYGWAIASAGEHYSKTDNNGNEGKIKKYPLYKSHKKHGFIEPLKSFVPSIAISEITKMDNGNYVVSSLKDKSLYFFKLNNKKKIDNFYRVEVFERIRDIRYKENKLYMFLEDTASIGVIDVLPLQKK